MTSELASQVADAVLMPPDCGSSADDHYDSSMTAFAAVALQMLVQFPPELLLANALTAVSPSSSSSSSSPPRLLVSISVLTSCVQVWGAASPPVMALVAAYGLPALHAVGFSLRTHPFSISSSTAERATLFSRVLPREAASAVESIVRDHSLHGYSDSRLVSAKDFLDPHDAWSCLCRCLCAAVEHASAADLPPILTSVSTLLPQLTSVGPCFASSTIAAFGDVLQRPLQDGGSAGVGVRMCIASLKDCRQQPTSPKFLSSFDIERTRVILQVRAHAAPPRVNGRCQ
jgi:hypothetical protein